ncbi:MAG TPA: 4Fe-4S dicluster domain-containing protein [Candidatus Deferrimicrobium sp.]|nr:4Fe-4S dicluster domain-containing protein [Candidatus Deferrimicrobium sp.]
MSDQCIKCDECTKACPIVAVSNEKEIWRIFFGESMDIWNCSSCFRCEASCPVNLSVRDALFIERRALKKSTLPQKFIEYFNNIMEYGNVFEIGEFVNERRKNLGLEPIDFQRIRTELKKLLDDSL